VGADVWRGLPEPVDVRIVFNIIIHCVILALIRRVSVVASI
jgi:hypothetical protein